MSKILLIVSDIITSVTVIGTFVAVFWMKDISPLAFLIPGVFGLSSIAHGFYFWKAKAENLHKFGRVSHSVPSGIAFSSSRRFFAKAAVSTLLCPG